MERTGVPGKFVLALSLSLLVNVVLAVAFVVALAFDISGGPSGEQQGPLFWTIDGLEAIPAQQWTAFDSDSDAYADNFPLPGDKLLPEHLALAQTLLELAADDDIARSDMLARGYLSVYPEPVVGEFVVDGETFVDTRGSNVSMAYFDAPQRVTRGPAENRAYVFAQEWGHETPRTQKMFGPAFGYMRESHEEAYLYPDMCDATGILRRAFLSLLAEHQLRSFYKNTTVGLWHSLFPEVERREFRAEDVALSRQYCRLSMDRLLTRRNFYPGWVIPNDELYRESVMRAVGLNVTDAFLAESMDPADPIGLGNLVANRVHAWVMANDGLQEQMDFVDKPALAAIAAEHADNPSPFKWEGALAGARRFRSLREGIVTQQTFVSPSLGVSSFLYDSEEDYVALGLQAAVPSLNVSQAAYRARTTQFLESTRNLTLAQRVKAHLINDKVQTATALFYGLDVVEFALADAEGAYYYKESADNNNERDYAPFEYYYYYFANLGGDWLALLDGIAEYAALHAAWRHKRTYLAMRPHAAIEWLSANDAEWVTNNTDLLEDYDPSVFIPAGDHPDYPSGSCTIYATIVHTWAIWVTEQEWATKLNLTADHLLNFSQASGEPVITYTLPRHASHWWDMWPPADVTVGWATLAEFLAELPSLRVWAGVHFLEAGEAGVALAQSVAPAVMRLWARLEAGSPAAMWTSAEKSKINLTNERDPAGIYELSRGEGV